MRVRSRILSLAGALVMASSVLAGCGSSESSGGGSSASVPPGATKEQYQEALADVAPVKLSFQMPTAPGDPTTAPAEAYAKALEEWSGGKVTLELLYSGSRAPIHEMTTALGDGLVDGGMVLPFADPGRFPLYTWLQDLLTTASGSPVLGTMELFSSWAAFGVQNTEVVNEFRNNGIEPLLPFLPGNGNGLFCTREVNTQADLKGGLVRSNTPLNTRAVKALGASPTDVPTSEIYSSLERGVVNCAVSALAVASSLGMPEVAKHWTLDNEVQFAPGGGGIGFNKAKWDKLPLVVRQLLWDRLDVYLSSSIRDREFGVFLDALTKAESAGVKVSGWSDDATRKLLADTFAAAREEAASNAPSGVDGAALVKAVHDNAGQWAAALKELGYADTGSVTWSEFVSWWNDNKDSLNLQPLLDRLQQEVMDPARPTK